MSDPSRLQRRWVVLVGAAVVYASFALITASTGALVPELRDGLGLSNTEMGMILGAWQFVYIGSSIPAGRLFDRFGARRAILFASLLIALSGALRPLATGFWSLAAAVGLMGIGAPIISIGAPAVAANLFEQESRRLAVGIYSTAPSIGSIVGLMVPTSVLGPLLNDSWRPILAIQAGLAGLAVIFWFLVSGGLDRQMKPGAGLALSSYRSLASLPVMRFVLAMAAINFFFVHGIGQWLVDILASHGWSKAEAGTGAAWAAAVGMVGSFVLPRLANERRRRLIMVGALTVGALGALALANPSTGVLLTALTLNGSTKIALMPLLVMIMMDHPDVGPTRIAAASGLYFSIAQLGGVAGPAFTGAASEASGGFALPLVVFAATMVVVAGFVSLRYERFVGAGASAS